jgi:hypothetical protein
MRQHNLLFIVFCHISLAMLQFPYPKQTFQLPNHPSNWMCTVHITVETFANTTNSDITERLLTSNREKIIPTLSTMVNRTISIVPVISFFEHCTISILIDATVHGWSHTYKEHPLYSYFRGNEYVYRGWKHSIIILMYFSCDAVHTELNLWLPHRLFYHSIDCGNEDIFPNEVFVPNPLPHLREIPDQTHSIHYRQLPLAIRRLIATPKYGWNGYKANIKPSQCLASRWGRLSQMWDCSIDVIAVHHYQLLLNFTTVANTLVNVYNYGEILTFTNPQTAKRSISLHAIDSMNRRIIYCDRNSDSQKLRPISLSSPFSFVTWVTLVSLLILCAIASSFAIFDMRSVAKQRTTINFIKTIFNSLVELIMCLVEKDIGKNNCAKAFIGLLVIGLGNDYKNYLTIELVYPRAGDAIHNLTELLNLNFNVFAKVDKENITEDNPTWLKRNNLHLEVDETKREKYVREAETWLKLVIIKEIFIMKELLSVTSKNAWIISAPYYTQVYYLNLMKVRRSKLSCHFVKRPLGLEFVEYNFYNSAAEEFKWWTAKFLDHGLFEFWKRLDSHLITLRQRRLSALDRSKRSNSSSVESLDVQNFVGQLHLIVFYIVIAILTAICVAIFLLEFAMQKA